METKKKLLMAEIVAGMIILLGGLMMYGLGFHKILPVPRPDLVCIGTTLIGTLLIVAGVCDLFTKKTKEMIIEEKDERNIALANEAMALGFKVLTFALGIVMFALIFMGYMNVVSCFSITGTLFVGQAVFMGRLWYLHKTR